MRCLHFVEILVKISCGIKVTEREIFPVIPAIRQTDLHPLRFLDIFLTRSSSLTQTSKSNSFSTPLVLQSSYCEYHRSVDCLAFETWKPGSVYFYKFNAFRFPNEHCPL